MQKSKRFKEIISTQRIVDTWRDVEYHGLVDTEFLDFVNERENQLLSEIEDLQNILDDILGSDNHYSLHYAKGEDSYKIYINDSAQNCIAEIVGIKFFEENLKAMDQLVDLLNCCGYTF